MARVFKNDKCIIIVSMKNKVKVVLLCHYWSDDMAEMVGRKHYFRELSPWIQETINLFKGKNDIELHVVAPNYASNSDVDSQKDGIIFHYYRYAPRLLSAILLPIVRMTIKHNEPHKIAERTANLITRFITPKRRIPPIINAIKPDIIHLYGSENLDYSVGILPFLEKVPVLLTIQGYAYLMKKSDSAIVQNSNNLRAKYEDYINKRVHYVTNYGIDYGFEPFENGQKKYVLSAITRVPKEDASKTEKKYDIVFYARINEEKGIEDLLHSLGLLKRSGKTYNAVVVGKAEETYLSKLKGIVEEEGLKDSVTFTGFLDDHEDVYRIASSAKVLAFPSHNDVSPNTIRESMFMRLPVVAYGIGGVPFFNVHKECICLVDSIDVNKFSKALNRVLNDDQYREMLIKNAYDDALNYYAPERIYQQTIDIYKDVLAK